MTLSVLALTAALVFVMDVTSKIFAVNNISQGQSIAVIPDIFHITLVLNNGAAFGLFKEFRAFFIAISIIVIILIIAYTFKNMKGGLPFTMALAFGLILGGACGNLVDRIRFGYVIDFLDFRIWPVFNIADSAISTGTIILVWNIFAHNPKRTAKK